MYLLRVVLCFSNMLQYRIENKVFNLKSLHGWLSFPGMAAEGSVYQLPKINLKNLNFPRKIKIFIQIVFGNTKHLECKVNNFVMW